MNSYKTVYFSVSEGVVPGDALIGFNEEEGKEINVIAGSHGIWRIIFIAGKGGIVAGGGIGVMGPHMGFKFGFRPQDIYPERMEYTTMTTTTKTATLRLDVESKDPKHTWYIAKVTVEEGHLEEGDRVEICIGDRSYGSPGAWATAYVERGVKIRLFADPDGSGEYKEIEGSPLIINIVPDSIAKKYFVFLPSIVGVGEKAEAHIIPVDKCGNFTPEARASLTIASEPIGHEMLEADFSNGAVKYPVNLREGINCIWVKDERGSEGLSNPCLCVENPEYKVFWGDIHAHAYDATELDVLTEDNHPERNYWYGHYVAGLDFCSLASHIFAGEGIEKMVKWWDLAREAVRKYYEPGKYVTLLGFEWRGLGGDRNGIFPTEDVEPFNPERDGVWELHRKVKEYGGIVVPHVGGAIADWDYHDPETERVGEIASAHGNFEWFMQEALARGLRVGFIASSDGHCNRPGHPRFPVRGGGRFSDLNRRDAGYSGASLAAVWAKELTRESLWEAIRARRTYASTGARMIIKFFCDNHFMGEEYDTEGEVVIRGEVIGTAPIETVEVIRNQELIYVHKGDGGTEIKFEFVDVDAPQGVSYYYLRVIQLDGEIGWASPVWVENKTGGAEVGRKYPEWNADVIPEVSESERKHAEAHLGKLMEYLEREEPGRFKIVQAVRVVDSPMGKYVYFLGEDLKLKARVHIKYFLETPEPMIRVNLGWRDFGQYRR